MAHFRPRLRFSLGTFFVLVTLLAVGLGYVGQEWRKVQERREVVRWLEQYRDGPSSDDDLEVLADDINVSWIRRMFGDKGGTKGYYLPPDKEKLARVRAVFPDARAYKYYSREPVDLDSLK